MTETTEQIPPPLPTAHERITERPYESAFAQMPSEEVHRRTTPGAGPVGGLDDGPRNVPLLLVAVGLAVMFATFVAAHWVTLVAGAALVLAGVVAGMARARPVRLWRGVGTIRKG